MEISKDMQNRLTERMVRNDDIFCSLLFDSGNRTLRVVDFRGGNFQAKHNYLERVLMAEGMRKIFTLIERDDMNGWQRVGYKREGSIPGYYKRSDAYIMSRIYDDDYDSDQEQGEDSQDNKKLITDVKNVGRDMSETKVTPCKADQITETEVIEIVNAELKRAAAKSTSKSKKKKKAPEFLSKPSIPNSVFSQFSREIEHHYFVIQNRRTKQANVIGAEYQDCFGNAKIQLYFEPKTKAEQNLARSGVLTVIDMLAELGAVSIFSTVKTEHVQANVIFAAAGFRNTGWMSRQLLTDTGASDVILWTKKLI